MRLNLLTAALMAAFLLPALPAPAGAHPASPAGSHPAAPSEVHPGASTGVHPAASSEVHPGASTGVHPAASSEVHPASPAGVHPAASSEVHPGASTGVHPAASLEVYPAASTGVHPASPTDGPALEPPATYTAPYPGHYGEPAPAPARARRRADRCAGASLAELGRRAGFTVFAPRERPAGWVPAVCRYPPGGGRAYGLRIHFHAAWTALPPAGFLEPRIAGIAQTKAFLSHLTAKYGRPVRLRGTVARFMPWPPGFPGAGGQPAHGGILRWIERGTLIEIDSRILTKKQMIRLAESLVPLGETSGTN